MSPTGHLLDATELKESLVRAGFRFGDKGTHTSRTIMLSELVELLTALPAEAERAEYQAVIVGDNILGKATTSTRRLTNQRLGELYGLDLRVPIFRAMRTAWAVDPEGRPLLALLCALARDPLLRATMPAVLDLPVGSELVRATFLDSIREAVGSRLNEAVLDKVARNVASSWSQAGHLVGRVRKVRQRVMPTPGALAFGLWLGAHEGLAGDALLESRWTRVLDRTGRELVPLLLQAKQLGLVHARVGGGVTEIGATQLGADIGRH
jgi:hypothetical protein